MRLKCNCAVSFTNTYSIICNSNLVCVLAIAIFTALPAHGQPLSERSKAAISSTKVISENFVASPSVLTDGLYAPEGTSWDSAESVILPSSNTAVIFEFDKPTRIGAVSIQADGNDVYMLECERADGWRTIWRALPSGTGLRTRAGDNLSCVTSRLRIRALGGDQKFSLSEVSFYETAPPTWPQGIIPAQSTTIAPRDSHQLTAIGKELITVAALATFMSIWLLLKASVFDRYKKAFDATCWLLVSLGMLAWWNFGVMRAWTNIHTWDVYHYYIGSKYLQELGYNGIYDCSAIAESELDGELVVVSRTLRDLTTNKIVSASQALLHKPHECRKSFTDVRWAQFKQDISWFKGRLNQRWAKSQLDHGFNASPAWSVIGSFLTNSAGPISEKSILWLTRIDLMLLLITWGIIGWSFGPLAAAAGLIFFGTNTIAGSFWTGGAFLRHDWLAALAISLALMKQNKMTAAGAFLAYAGHLRLFPFLILAGLIFRTLFVMLKNRSFQVGTDERRLFAGFAIGLVSILCVATISAGRLSIWSDFFANTVKHAGTPLTNHMGLKTIVSYDSRYRAKFTKDDQALEPFSAWKDARRETFKKKSLDLFWLYPSFLHLDIYRCCKTQ